MVTMDFREDEEEQDPPGAEACNPSEIFLQNLTSEVNKEDVYNMVQDQQHMLSRFEKTNEMLLNFNSLSKTRYEQTCQDFQRHTELLSAMKKDLDSIFKRIRAIKTTVGKQYPQAFSAYKDTHQPQEGEEEEDQDATTPMQPMQPSFLQGHPPSSSRLPRQQTLPSSSSRLHGHRILPRQHSMPAPLPEEPSTPIREPAIGAEEGDEDNGPLGTRSQPDGSADMADRSKSN